MEERQQWLESTGAGNKSIDTSQSCLGDDGITVCSTVYLWSLLGLYQIIFPRKIEPRGGFIKKILLCLISMET